MSGNEIEFAHSLSMYHVDTSKPPKIKCLFWHNNVTLSAPWQFNPIENCSFVEIFFRFFIVQRLMIMSNAVIKHSRSFSSNQEKWFVAAKS